MREYLPLKESTNRACVQTVRIKSEMELTSAKPVLNEDKLANPLWLVETNRLRPRDVDARRAKDIDALDGFVAAVFYPMRRL